MIRSLSKYIKSYLIFYVFFLDKVVECDIINIKLFNKTLNKWCILFGCQEKQTSFTHRFR